MIPFILLVLVKCFKALLFLERYDMSTVRLCGGCSKVVWRYVARPTSPVTT